MGDHCTLIAAVVAVAFIILSPHDGLAESIHTTEKHQYVADLSDRIVRQLLLIPDDAKSGQKSTLDFDAFEQIVETLFSLNEAAKLSSHPHNYATETVDIDRASNAKDDLAINQYLSIGGTASTSRLLGFSSACDVCASVVKVVGPLVQSDALWPRGVALVKSLCLRSGLSKMACDGYIDIQESIIRYMLPNVLTAPYTLCNAVLGNLGCGNFDHFHSLWEIALPEPLPATPVSEKKFSRQGKLRALLMTDIHIDLEYAIGSPTRCLENMCCRNNSTPITYENGTIPDKDKAPYWGDYRSCDLPIWTFDEMLREINETHGNEIDFVFMAGDLPPHDNWNQSKEVHMEIIEMVTSKMAEKFPGIPVFFAVGNHEPAPVNLFPLPQDQDKFSNQWLMDKLADTWVKLLDPTIANSTVRLAGFYTVVLKPGWRLITINDNYCLGLNFYLYARPDISDPYGHLKWMVDILTEAEKNGEKVQILGHIPPGNHDCLQAWSWNYYRIISRFGHIITGQFFGHIHKDYFIMHYDAETLTIPKSVLFVGPPGTPFSRNNIGYRIYDFDSTSFDLLDHHTYYADIDEANLSGNKKQLPWKFEYSAKETYGLSDMSAASWSNLAKAMQTNDTLFAAYRSHYKLHLRDVLEPCGLECRRNRLCEIYQGFSADPAEAWCERFFPRKVVAPDAARKCSARFVRRVDLN